MISLNCHGVIGIDLGTPQYFPPTAPETHAFWSMEILVSFNRGADTLRIVTYAHEHDQLAPKNLAISQRITPVSVPLEVPARVF